MALAVALALVAGLDPAVEAANLSATRIVVVYGEAHEAAAPDFAIVKFAVRAERPTSQESLAQEADDIDALSASLKKAGVTPRDLHTLSPTIATPNFAPGLSPPRNHVARGVLSVVVHPLDRLDAVLRLGGSQGAEIENIQYDTTERKPREDALRAAALEDARRKAEIDAEAVGMKLGAARSVVEEDATTLGAATRNTNQTIYLPNIQTESGAVQLKQGVFVTFELAPK